MQKWKEKVLRDHAKTRKICEIEGKKEKNLHKKGQIDEKNFTEIPSRVSACETYSNSTL